MLLLSDLYQQFPTRYHCLRYLAKVRWATGVQCIYCNSKLVSQKDKTYRYICKSCHAVFSPTSNSIFFNSHIDLQKWFFGLLVLKKRTISKRKLAQHLQISDYSAWLLVRRIKKSFREKNTLASLLLEDLDKIITGDKHF